MHSLSPSHYLLPSDLFDALSELIILTASRCLHGKEIRSMLDEKVAQLYADLDGGFTHAAWLLPGWLPLPSFRCIILFLSLSPVKQAIQC